MSDDEVELEITSLAAGGDGVGRDANGRVTFVPRAAPGDRVRVRVVHATKSFARAELQAVVAAGASRVAPACEYFEAGCGGCAWQHVTREAQLAAKHAIVTSALRKLVSDSVSPGFVLEPIADPCPALGWRRRARFHVEGGRIGLYAGASTTLVPLAHCPQLEGGLDAALAAIAAAPPSDGELHVLRGYRGDIVVGVAAPWPAAPALVGASGIVGVRAASATHGQGVIEVEPGLWAGAFDFAQASAAGNAALVATTRAALGRGPGALLEVFAGAGNLTRAFVADGWTVLATDVVPPERPVPGVRFEAGEVERVVARLRGNSFDAVVLDPPRAGLTGKTTDALAALAAPVVVYVSCDPATLARDALRLVQHGYRAQRAWPIDLMPQTAHVEVVVRFTRIRPAA